MPGAPPRRPRHPRPQTLRCRYEDNRGRCRSIATIEGHLCLRHAQALTDHDPIRRAADRLGSVFGRMFGGDRELQEVMGGAAGTAVLAFADYLRRSAAGGGAMPRAVSPQVWEQIRPPPPPPPPPPAAHAADLEVQRARRVLGFPSTGPLARADVLARRRELARKHHPDLGGEPGKMAKINAAADLLERHLAA